MGHRPRQKPGMGLQASRVAACLAACPCPAWLPQQPLQLQHRPPFASVGLERQEDDEAEAAKSSIFSDSRDDRGEAASSSIRRLDDGDRVEFTKIRRLDPHEAN